MASVEVKNVDLVFPVYGIQKSLRKSMFTAAVGGIINKNKNKKRQVSVTALQNVNFTLSDGDRLGIIGPNGAGKSTLLRLLAGIFHPTNGIVSVDGRVSSLFTSGVGMDLEDSGYENIYTCGLYLGLSNKEIHQIVPEIEEFTELGDFLSLPVRTYSTGMMVRLAFAITTAIHPEILLLDEGLGAGDAKFAEKANQRVNDLIGRASILVIASHSDNLIEKFCNKAMFLNEGQLIALGPVDEVTTLYRETIAD